MSITYLRTPNAFVSDQSISGLNILLASVFTLYLKTKNFHWHLSGPHFRDYHLMFDEQATQIFDMTDDIAERVRKLGGTTIHSFKEVLSLNAIPESNDAFVDPQTMLTELRCGNQMLVDSMRAAHETCQKEGDIATAAMLEVWIDQAQRRIWFLFEAAQ